MLVSGLVMAAVTLLVHFFSKFDALWAIYETILYLFLLIDDITKPWRTGSTNDTAV